MSLRILSSHQKPLRESRVNVQHSDSSSQSGWWKLRPRYSSERKGDKSKPSESSCVVIAAAEGSSLCSVLAQTCGGPLLSVQELQSQPYPMLLLDFLLVASAVKFSTYVKSGRCRVNGHPIVLVPINDEILSVMKLYSSLHTREEHPLVARRTLEIFRPVSEQCMRLSESRKYISSHVDLVWLRNTLERFGRVVQIRPMIFQRSIAFAVDFDCVNAAVHAKEKFELEKSSWLIRDAAGNPGIFDRLRGWLIQFSQDIAERPCPF